MIIDFVLVITTDMLAQTGASVILFSLVTFLPDHYLVLMHLALVTMLIL